MNTNHPAIRRYAALCAAGLFAVGLTACGDDDDTSAADDPGTTVVDAEPASDDPGDGETVTITAVDWSFEDLPESVPVGTKLSLQNEGGEPHELVAMRIPDEETRSVAELVKLPPEEMFAVFGADAEPTMVLLAKTGTTDTPGAVVGDGTLTETGRYAIVCFLPVGAHDDVLDAEGPPESDAPPHVSQGMFAELVVD
jgi:hypothetical protein